MKSNEHASCHLSFKIRPGSIPTMPKTSSLLFTVVVKKAF
jgi:hypothetical protein